MLLRSLHIASRQLFYFSAVVTTLALLGILAVLWISEEISERKDELAAWVGHQVGYRVEIGYAGLYLLELIPKLEVRDIQILDDSGEYALFSLGQAYMSLDILASIEQQTPVIKQVKLDNADVSVTRTADGTWQIGGLAPATSPKQTTAQQRFKFTRWLNQIQFSDINVHYTDMQYEGLSRDYRIQGANVWFDSDQWRLKGALMAEDAMSAPIKIALGLDWDEDMQLQHAEAEVEAKDLALAELLQAQALDGVTIQSGSVSTVSRIDYTPLHTAATVTLDVSALTLLNPTIQQEPVSLTHLSGTFELYGANNGWQIESEGLNIQLADKPWPITPLQIYYQSENQSTELSVDYVNLGELTAFVSVFNSLPQPIRKTRPVGELHHVDLNINGQGVERLTLEATELSLLTTEQWPGVNNLSFKLAMQADQGALVLDTHNTDIFATQWFEDVLHIDSATGTLSWRFQDDNWHFYSRQFRFFNDEIEVALNGRLNHYDETTQSDLVVELKEMQVASWQHYVPKHLIPERFEQWAKPAFVAGVIKTGKIELQGNLAAFPFDKQPHLGRFDMRLDVEGVELDYASPWPALKNVKGIVTGQGNHLDIDATAGTVADLNFKQVKAHVSNLVRPKPVLTVKGDVVGTSTQAFAFLNNSPLNRRFGKMTSWMQLQGQSTVNVNLTVPLVDPDKTQVTGYVGFADTQLSIDAVPELRISQINGKLGFSNHGVTAENIKGRAFEQPVGVKVLTESGKTRVQIEGHATIPALRTVWPALFPDFMSGETDYLAEVIVEEPKEGQFDVSLDIRSSLEGVDVLAPAPLGKTSAQRAPLNVKLEFEPVLSYYIDYQDWLRAGLISTDAGLSGEIKLGGEAAKKHKKKLSISGELAELNLTDWQDWQATQPPSESSLLTTLDAVDVKLGKLWVSSMRFDNVMLNANPASSAWRLDLKADQFDGSVTIPIEISNASPLVVEMKRFHITLPEKSSAATSSNKKDKLWPPLQLTIQDFQLAENHLGELKLSAKQFPTRWQVETVTLTSPVLSATAEGHWEQSNTSSGSQFTFNANSEALDKLLRYYNYQVLAEAKGVNVSGVLGWPGTPADLSIANLGGNLNIAVGKGRLIDVEPGTAGRIFGLLSITALPRRLALDFSDLFGKGFGFSSIKGRFQFSQGLATTEDMLMQGDSADIAVKGPIDLVNKTYNQTVKVTPKVSSTLPLAGAVAGGPVGLGVGTAILIVDKIAGKIFDREIVNLISYSYQLKGPWANPQLNVLAPSTPKAE
jgi:uncharacterized protein (TIGR02099 family)